MLVLAMASAVWAFTVVKNPDGSLTVIYTEPTELINGRALTNLMHTTIYVREISPGTSQASVQVPATAPTGGGVINHTFTPAVSLAARLLAVYTTATRETGDESLRGQTIYVSVP